MTWHLLPVTAVYDTLLCRIAGATPHDLCDIRIGDRKLQVTRSLRRALIRMRDILRESDEDAFLWIDQICMYQDNVQERNQQVHNMWRIFSTAAHVYAWLGDHESDDRNRASRWLRRASHHAAEHNLFAQRTARCGVTYYPMRFQDLDWTQLEPRWQRTYQAL